MFSQIARATGPFFEQLNGDFIWLYLQYDNTRNKRLKNSKAIQALKKQKQRNQEMKRSSHCFRLTAVCRGRFDRA